MQPPGCWIGQLHEDSFLRRVKGYTVDRRVSYKRDAPTNILSLNIPMEAAANKDQVEEYQVPPPWAKYLYSPVSDFGKTLADKDLFGYTAPPPPPQRRSTCAFSHVLKALLR